MLTPPPPAPPAAVTAYHWGSLTLAGENTSFRQSITFDYMGRNALPPSAPLRWVLHRVTQPNPSIRKEDWADGVSCPNLGAAMHALFAVPGPHFSDPADPEARATRVIMDGTDFVLEGEGGLPLDPPERSTLARVSIESNDEGPLGRWFAKLTLATQGCWTSTPQPIR